MSAHTEVLTEHLPSQETRATWLHAFRQTGDYPDATEFSGKWMMFYHAALIDQYWLKIKAACEQGYLGSQVKVTTARGAQMPLPRADHSTDRALLMHVLGLQKPEPPRDRAHVICVYTYDYTDIIDVMGIRETLRELGIRRKITYKSNADTRAGRYGADYTPIYRA